MTEKSLVELKRGPLYDAQIRNGAKFGEMAGCRTPLSFAGPLLEHKAVRESAGLFDRTYHGAIRISGTESAQFLNGLVSNDVKTLQPGRWLHAAFLTAHGKVKALCSIHNLGDALLLLNDPQTHDKVYSFVFPFSYAGDFKVEEASVQYRTISVEGPRSEAVIKEICFEPASDLGDDEWRNATIAGAPCLLRRYSRTGERGFLIMAAEAGVTDVWEFILMKGAFHGIAPIGLAAAEILRIEAGIPMYGSDIDETNMLLECGLPDYASFTKGCYVGQEAVAMATYRGHISKKLCGIIVESDSVPPNSAKLFAESKEVGRVTSSLASPSLGRTICLGYVKYGFFDVGKRLDVEMDHTTVQGQIVALPFCGSERP